MTEDELSEIEDRAMLASRTGTSLPMQPMDVLALCKALREAYQLGGQLQRERDLALESLERIEKHMAAFHSKIGDLEKLVGRRRG